jgi:hypothetical protein
MISKISTLDRGKGLSTEIPNMMIVYFSGWILCVFQENQ